LTVVPHQLQKWSEKVQRSCEEAVEPGRGGVDWKVVVSGGFSIYFAHTWLILRPVDVGKPRGPTIGELFDPVGDPVPSVGLGDGEAGCPSDLVGDEPFWGFWSREGGEIIDEAGFQEFEAVVAPSVFFFCLLCDLMVELLPLLDGDDESLGDLHDRFRARVKAKGSGGRFWG
jgi:hypothetical protein